MFLISKLGRTAVRTGRFDLKIYVGAPDNEARVETLKQYMKNRPQEYIDWDLIAKKTEGHTFADLKLLTDKAAKMALLDHSAIGMKQFYELLEIE